MEWVKEYIKHGFAIFPVRPQSKIPWCKHGFKDASTDLAVIKKLFKNKKGANIGIRTGKESGIVVLDVDPQHGGDDTLKALKERGLPETLTARSGGGGFHLYFKYYPTPTISNLYPGIDFKADNGCITAPPSIHPTGKPYIWEDFNVPIVDLPNWLLNDILARNGNPVPIAASSEIGLQRLKEAVDEISRSPQGDRNNILYHWGYVIYGYVKAGEISKIDADNSLKRAAHVTGLIDREIQSTLNSAWKNAKIATATGKPKRLMSDQVLANILKYFDFKYNELTDEILLLPNEGENGYWHVIDDKWNAYIANIVRDTIGTKYIQHTQDCISQYCLTNSFHPLKNYFSALSKREKPTAIKKLCSYFKDRYKLFTPFFIDWLIGAVKRIYEPSQNPMLILDGRQGLGKSEFVRWLTPSFLRSYHYEGAINPQSKDFLYLLATKWIWEVAELEATTRRADREALKSFITLETVTIRKPYDRYPIKKRAVASFIGTINGATPFLNDPTGYRRFRIVPLKEINWDYSKEVNVNDIWAEAFYLYKEGLYTGLPAQAQILAGEIVKEYEEESYVGFLFKQFFVITGDDTDYEDMDHVHEVLLNEYRGNPIFFFKQLREFLSRHNIRKKRKRSKAERYYVYIGILSRQKAAIRQKTDITNEDILDVFNDPPF